MDNKPKDHIQGKPADAKDVKRFPILKEEKEMIQDLQTISKMLQLQNEGIRNSILLELARIRKRLDIKEMSDKPGLTRVIDFDPVTYEYLVKDFVMPKMEPKKSETTVTEAKEEKLSN